MPHIADNLLYLLWREVVAWQALHNLLPQRSFSRRQAARRGKAGQPHQRRRDGKARS